MEIRDDTGDENAIQALIGAHFEGLKWTPSTQPDWVTFSADFLPDASLFPAARPPDSARHVFPLPLFASRQVPKYRLRKTVDRLCSVSSCHSFEVIGQDRCTQFIAVASNLRRCSGALN